MNIVSQIRHPDFLSNKKKLHFINGKWQASAVEDWIESRNPATGEVLALLSRGQKADVDAAVQAARAAFEGPWSRFTPHQRQKFLITAHDVIARNWDELCLIESLDMGAPLLRLQSMKDFILQLILFFSSQAMNCRGETVPSSLAGNYTTMILKEPVGVVGGIIGWNGPMMGQWWALGGALATGCTAVLKPAEDAALSVLRVAELLTEAGLPEGVVNVVTGYGAEAGAALAGHPDVDRVAFTGSTVTGREIIRSSAVNIKRVQVELGGKSPDIVFADADLDRAVPGAAMAVYNNSGQLCSAGTRLFVQRSIQDKFLEKLVDFTRTIRVGDPLDTSSQLGPVISQRQLDRVMGYVSAGLSEGAKLVIGGNRIQGDLANGYYIEPTVFCNVNNNMKIAREEIFGPVISVIPFDTEDEALQLANDTDYGLGGAVWTSSVKTMQKMMHGIKAGQIWVNCYGLVDPSVGFGGFKQSGYGWKGGTAHVEGYLYQKAVTISGD